MKNEEIIKKLNKLHEKSYSLKDFDKQLQNNKKKYVEENNQEEAKLIWIYQTIVEIHNLYRKAFTLLQNKSYYEAWCQLERVEITFKGLKGHFLYDKEQYFLYKIEKSIKNLQVIFPYRLFGSAEIIKKKKKCSICNQEVSIRKPCGHEVGEIYDGEMCHRIVTEAEPLALSLVENPGNKYSVMFLQDEKTKQQIDQYNYDAIDYLFEHIKSPYERWDLEVSQRYHPHENYKDIGRNDNCPCNSGLKYKKCCLNKPGVKYAHFEFLVENPSENELFTNTLKKLNDR